MKIAIIQLATVLDLEENFKNIDNYVRQAAEQSVEWIILPEEFLTLTLSQSEKLTWAETLGNGPLQKRVADLAREYKLNIVAGTLPITSQNKEKFYSATLIFNPSGDRILDYNKIHLFDVDIEDGKETYCESEYVSYGQKIKIQDLEYTKIGVAICYDLRFPEMFRYMALKGAQVIILPSAFTIPTGEKHWKTLLRARAIENLCFICACNNVGFRKNGEGTYGHSMIIDPWGEVLAELQDQQDMIIQDIKLEKVNKLRKSFPVLEHTQEFIINQWFHDKELKSHE